MLRFVPTGGTAIATRENAIWHVIPLDQKLTYISCGSIDNIWGVTEKRRAAEISFWKEAAINFTGSHLSQTSVQFGQISVAEGNVLWATTIRG